MENNSKKKLAKSWDKFLTEVIFPKQIFSTTITLKQSKTKSKYIWPAKSIDYGSGTISLQQGHKQNDFQIWLDIINKYSDVKSNGSSPFQPSSFYRWCTDLDRDLTTAEVSLCSCSISDIWFVIWAKDSFGMLCHDFFIKLMSICDIVYIFDIYDWAVILNCLYFRPISRYWEVTSCTFILLNASISSSYFVVNSTN